jgi:hypothetical protein
VYHKHITVFSGSGSRVSNFKKGKVNRMNPSVTSAKAIQLSAMFTVLITLLACGQSVQTPTVQAPTTQNPGNNTVTPVIPQPVPDIFTAEPANFSLKVSDIPEATRNEIPAQYLDGIRNQNFLVYTVKKPMAGMNLLDVYTPDKTYLEKAVRNSAEYKRDVQYIKISDFSRVYSNANNRSYYESLGVRFDVDGVCSVPADYQIIASNYINVFKVACIIHDIAYENDKYFIENSPI